MTLPGKTKNCLLWPIPVKSPIKKKFFFENLGQNHFEFKCILRERRQDRKVFQKLSFPLSKRYFLLGKMSFAVNWKVIILETKK